MRWWTAFWASKTWSGQHRPDQTALQAHQGRVLSTDTQSFQENLGLPTLARPGQTAFQQGRVLSSDTQILEENLGPRTLAGPALARPNSIPGPRGRILSADTILGT